jgi:toxin YoeB
MGYVLMFDVGVYKDIEKHKKSGNKQLLKKIDHLLNELREHPTFKRAEQ